MVVVVVEDDDVVVVVIVWPANDCDCCEFEARNFRFRMPAADH